MSIHIINCPSCGGKTKFNYDKNLWECSYCKKSFVTLFAPKEKDLPSYDIKERVIYYNRCSHCGKEYTGFQDHDTTCIYCGGKGNNPYDSLVASSFCPSTLTSKELSSVYGKKNLNSNIKKYFKEYLTYDFTFEYIRCDLLDGFIELKYKDKIKKYLFVHLLVPNLDYEDYRFMYELGNNGTRFNAPSNDYGITLLEVASKYKDNIQKEGDINHYDEIIKTCINTFQKEYHISDSNKIEINNCVNVKKGYYIPLYRKKVVIHSQEYYQYILANNNFSKSVYIQYPKIENAIKKSNFSNIIYHVSITIILISLFYLFAFGGFLCVFYSEFSLFKNLAIVTIMELPFFIILAIIFHKKIDFYYNSAVITREKYYDQIVNNSNFVKVIGGRR